MSKKLIEINRAEHSFAALNKFEGNKNDKDEMRSYIKKMPMLIKTNGLGQTLAFYFSKGKKDQHNKILDILADYFSKNKLLTVRDAKSLMGEVVKINANEYRLITNETIAYLNWLRRFADGLLK